MEKKIYKLKKDIYQLPNLKPNRHSARKILECIDCVDGEAIVVLAKYKAHIRPMSYVNGKGLEAVVLGFDVKELCECNGIITFLLEVD